jgi:hypothetical protein
MLGRSPGSTAPLRAAGRQVVARSKEIVYAAFLRYRNIGHSEKDAGLALSVAGAHADAITS